MEATVYLKNIHISPKKLRMVVDDIRTLGPNESLDYLFYSPKKGARILYKAIKSAIDNAKYTLKVSADLLKFRLLTVEQGNALKRFRPGGRGTAKPYKKKYAHLKIALVSTQVKKTPDKQEQKKVETAGDKDTKPVVKQKRTLKSEEKKSRVKKVSPAKESEIKK